MTLEDLQAEAIRVAETEGWALVQNNKAYWLGTKTGTRDTLSIGIYEPSIAIDDLSTGPQLSVTLRG